MEIGFFGLLRTDSSVLVRCPYGFALLRRHWLGVALIAQVAAVVVLGFFAPVLQLRLPTAILWLTVGLALALIRNEEADRRSRRKGMSPPARQRSGDQNAVRILDEPEFVERRRASKVVLDRAHSVLTGSVQR